MARAAIPRGFEDGPRSAMPSAVVVDWGELREMVVRLFPEFENPIGRDNSVSRKVGIGIGFAYFPTASAQMDYREAHRYY